MPSHRPIVNISEEARHASKANPRPKTAEISSETQQNVSPPHKMCALHRIDRNLWKCMRLVFKRTAAI